MQDLFQGQMVLNVLISHYLVPTISQTQPKFVKLMAGNFAFLYRKDTIMELLVPILSCTSQTFPHIFRRKRHSYSKVSPNGAHKLVLTHNNFLIDKLPNCHFLIDTLPDCHCYNNVVSFLDWENKIKLT